MSNHFESATSQQNGEALVALATVKQVRDFLCGSLKLKNAVLTQTIHPATIQVDFLFFLMLNNLIQLSGWKNKRQPTRDQLRRQSKSENLQKISLSSFSHFHFTSAYCKR